ncbi:MAG TPA: RecX family transcriptional regulator [Candidatus Saccharimonadales bacterium]|nr:RecX family transcriptional regulator [Candidatus Saccharimonadales bacterium]
MKITAIKQQIKQKNRYSVFVDGRYEFSLGESALLESKLVGGEEITEGELRELKKLSEDDKIYNQALRYIALRPRSKWEITFYLEKKKKASPALTEIILNKLSIIDMLDDEKLAKAFVHDRRLLRPTSRRKLITELRKKHISEEIIEKAIGNEYEDEQAALKSAIEKARRQSKYQDTMKLMQYLSRQGFNYGDIKDALQEESRE